MKSHFRKSILFLIIILVTGCTDGSSISLLNEENIELERKVNVLNEENKEFEKTILELEEEVRTLRDTVQTLKNTEQISESLKMEFIEDTYQDIVGVKHCDSSMMYLTPYDDSIELGIVNDDVYIISTGTNGLEEEWSLVEVIGRFTDSKYGYVMTKFLTDEVIGKFNYDELDISEGIKGIRIGSNIEAIIEEFGRNYYLVKDNNAYQIGYHNMNNGSHITFTIDSRSLKVRGIRTVDEEYPLNNGLAVGHLVGTVYELYGEDDIIVDGSHLFVKLQDGFMLSIQSEEEIIRNDLYIARIDIVPDWDGLFKIVIN